jgi:hypothetical protein
MTSIERGLDRVSPIALGLRWRSRLARLHGRDFRLLCLRRRFRCALRRCLFRARSLDGWRFLLRCCLHARCRLAFRLRRCGTRLLLACRFRFSHRCLHQGEQLLRIAETPRVIRLPTVNDPSQLSEISIAVLAHSTSLIGCAIRIAGRVRLLCRPKRVDCPASSNVQPPRGRSRKRSLFRGQDRPCVSS